MGDRTFSSAANATIVSSTIDAIEVKVFFIAWEGRFTILFLTNSAAFTLYFSVIRLHRNSKTQLLVKYY